MRTPISRNSHPVARTQRSILLAAAFCFFAPMTAFSGEIPSPTLLSKIVVAHAVQLAGIDSNAGAKGLFTTTVGPALGLKDVAGILGAKGMTAQVAKDLGIAELTVSVQELMAALAAWQLADSITQPTDAALPASLIATERQDWISATSRITNLDGFFRVLTEQRHVDSNQERPQKQRPELSLVAQQVKFEAHQRALAAWWSLYEWKDRIRQARGLARLCGTWQWIIHNHHNHQEQKMTIAFPPAGQTPPNVSVPAEAVVLGDSIYLRWEERGYVQEDSLLFITEGHKRDEPDQPMKIEGSFANNTGGWGPINAKRIAGCKS